MKLTGTKSCLPWAMAGTKALLELCPHAVDCAADDVVHVVVSIFRKAAAEDGAVFFFCQCGVVCIECLVPGVIDGIVGFFTRMPFCWIFARDVGDGLRAEFEVLMLDDACVGDFACGVVHDGDALMVCLLEALCFEAQTAVAERPELIAEIRVDRTSVDDCLCAALIVRPYLRLIVVYACADLDALEQGIDETVVAADGDALVAVIEIVVVEGVADRQAADDEGR